MYPGSGTPQDPWIIAILAPGPNPFTANVITNGAGLTGGDLTKETVQTGVFPIQDIWLNARGGTFTLSLLGYTTTALAWNSTAAQVQAALTLGACAIGNGHCGDRQWDASGPMAREPADWQSVRISAN